MELTFPNNPTLKPIIRSTKVDREPPISDITKSRILQKYNMANKIAPVLTAGIAVGAIAMTDGVDLYYSIQKGDGMEIAYYGARTALGVGFVAGSAKWGDKAFFKGLKIGKFGKFNIAGAVIAGLDVSYNIYKIATADSWLEQLEYAEKAEAALIDGVIGCIEPYGIAAHIGWQVGVFATNKLCDKFGIGESSAISESATSSIGAAVVFLSEEHGRFLECHQQYPKTLSGQR